MITVSEAIAKMITVCEGNQYGICHFMKVWAYAKTIGELEGVDEKTQRTLEYAAIVYDIACPSLRKEYGSAPGNLQEEYGPPLVREFYKDAGMEEETLERVCYLVSRHHTFTDVEGMDHRILLEADFLVNAGEQEKYHRAIKTFRNNVFRTKTGIEMLNGIYGDGGERN